MKQALSPANLKRIDKSDMLGLLLDFPEQCRASLTIADKAGIIFQKRNFNKIVFAGLGGSAIGADLVKSYLYFECSLPILVLREYELPACVDESTLVFLVSYSGNTEEILSAYAAARRKGATLLAVSSGGRLKELALKDNITFIEVPKNIPPRCALGYLSIIPLCVLEKLGLAKEVKSGVNQAIETLERLKKENLHPSIGTKDNIAKAAAARLFNKFTVVYASSVHFDVCASRLRGQLAENSKALASSHFFPEMNHNEIVGWQNPAKLFKNFAVVMLRDKEMHPRVSKRIDITERILNKEGVEIMEIWSRGQCLLSRIFSLIYIGDFVTYYLAILYGIDPVSVDRVAYLKKELSRE